MRGPRVIGLRLFVCRPSGQQAADGCRVLAEMGRTPPPVAGRRHRLNRQPSYVGWRWGGQPPVPKVRHRAGRWPPHGLASLSRPPMASPTGTQGPHDRLVNLGLVYEACPLAGTMGKTVELCRQLPMSLANRLSDSSGQDDLSHHNRLPLRAFRCYGISQGLFKEMLPDSAGFQMTCGSP